MITPSNDFWQVFKNTNGALSCTEAVAIMNIAAQAPEGVWIELGSYKGKSSMSAAFSKNKEKRFILVDPIYKDENECRGICDTVMKWFNPTLFPDYSTNVIQLRDDYAYVFVDSGSHQDGLPMQEVKLLEDKMVQGGIIAFHDWNSQFKEVKEASDYLVSTGKYEYIHIDWEEIIEYVNANNLEEGNLSWHHTELKNPCFVGAVKRI